MTRLAEALRQIGDGSKPLERPLPQAAAPQPGVMTATSGAPHGTASIIPGHAADLGTVRGFAADAAGKLVAMPAVPAAAVEQYRRLAASLHLNRMEKEAKIIMVTSASSGEGKTLTATNLALTLSQSYRRRVLLIDADLRRPTVHQIFKVPNVLGLSDGLKAAADERLSLLKVSEFLTILPAGRPDPDPMSGLTSDRMRRILNEAAALYDWVIVDTPPVGFLSDAKLLVGMVDAALFVVRAGKSPYRLVQRALDAVGRNRILGVVLNSIAENVDIAGYYYYGYYGSPKRGDSR